MRKKQIPAIQGWSKKIQTKVNTIIMHTPNQWPLPLRGAAALLIDSSNEQRALCVCVCDWLVLMSLMNRCGTQSLWTPAVAITP